MSDEARAAASREPKYHRPDEVPPDMTPLERAIVAAANIRLWADFLLDTGPPPEKVSELKDASKDAS